MHRVNTIDRSPHGRDEIKRVIVMRSTVNRCITQTKCGKGMRKEKGEPCDCTNKSGVMQQRESEVKPMHEGGQRGNEVHCEEESRLRREGGSVH